MEELDLFGLWQDTTVIPDKDIPFGSPSSRLAYFRPTLYLLKPWYEHGELLCFIKFIDYVKEKVKVPSLLHN